jgi:adenine deaminase
MQTLKNRISVGKGDKRAELVFKNARALDVFSGTWVSGDIAIVDGYIAGIGEEYSGINEINLMGQHVVPGFIDSHVHIESTMMLPSEYAKTVMPRGTTSAIWDPHEIANVFGVAGLEWAISCASSASMDLFVMLSSCVPSSPFETSGANISARDLAKLKNSPRVIGLAEVMNFPAVIAGEQDVLEKISAFSDMPIDGHSPLLRGKALNAYISAGMRCCHEICSIEEAREKISRGMRVLVREGSVAKNAAELAPVMTDYSGINCMLCTDDRNPLDIAREGHIDHVVRIAIQQGIRPEVAYRSAAFSTAIHYGLRDRGAVAPGYLADLIVLSNLEQVEIANVWKAGNKVGANDWNWKQSPQPPKENSIKIGANKDQLNVRVANGAKEVLVEVIEVIPEQILTGRTRAKLPVIDGLVAGNPDIQKIAVFERHSGNGNVGVGFVSGFSLKEGAIASSVAHDAHNIGVVGSSDEAMWAALKAVERLGGGIVAVNGNGVVVAEIALPVAGLMSTDSAESLIPKIEQLRKVVKNLGCALEEPFLQLSFLALPVIPSLKITDLGLIDVEREKVIPLVVKS